MICSGNKSEFRVPDLRRKMQSADPVKTRPVFSQFIPKLLALYPLALRQVRCFLPACSWHEGVTRGQVSRNPPAPAHVGRAG